MEDIEKKQGDSAYPIADLHCDLLAYLATDDKRSPLDEDVCCTFPNFKKGGVFFQTLAVFCETDKKSVAFAEKQFTIFRTLPQLYPSFCSRVTQLELPEHEGKLHLIAAIENASGLCSETEALEGCFTRFDQYRETAGPILYISLTWNHENRFGGGNLSKAGLKRDGELLLDYLSGKKIALDLSHTSDALAFDALNYIDRKGLQITPIASHSNFRSIANQPRNLPDELAKEVLKRGGVIGINFVKAFIGKTYPDDFMRQVDYARSLGAMNQLCFGADFFYDQDSSISLHPFIPFFYEPFSNASCYPEFIRYLNDVFTKQEIMKIAHENLGAFFARQTSQTKGALC